MEKKKEKIRINKHLLLIRIVALPFYIPYTLIFNILGGFILIYKWLLFGGQRLIFGVDHDRSIATLIEQNKKLIKEIQSK